MLSYRRDFWFDLLQLSPMSDAQGCKICQYADDDPNNMSMMSCLNTPCAHPKCYTHTMHHAPRLLRLMICCKNARYDPPCHEVESSTLYIVFLAAFLLLLGGVSTSTLVLMLLLSLLGVEYLSITLFFNIFLVLFSFSSRSSSGSTKRLTVR